MKAEKQKQSVSATSPGSDIAQLRQQYGCGPVVLTGNADSLYERHLFFDNVMQVTTIGARERVEADDGGPLATPRPEEVGPSNATMAGSAHVSDRRREAQLLMRGTRP